MVLDIRANVTCLVTGAERTVISGSISDDYIQGSGLVKTRGSIEVTGLRTANPGDEVSVNYTKEGITRSIPRRLRVFSCFADPFRNTTKIELGCLLSYLSDLKNELSFGGLDDPENTEFAEADAEIITVPIDAKAVLQKCVSELSLTATVDRAGLSNKFSVKEFDFSPGYVQVMNDLLVSECRYGYLDRIENLQFNTLDTAGGGEAYNIISEKSIIDVGPIGVGELPAEDVAVRYSTLKLEKGEVCDRSSSNWESEEIIGAPSFISIEYLFGEAQTPRTARYNYIPRTTIVSEYDDWDRLVTRTTTTFTIGATLNTQYYKDVALNGNQSFGDAWAVSEQTIVQVEIPVYRVPIPETDEAKKKKPENYNEVLSSTTTKTEPKMGTLGAAGISTRTEFSNGTSSVGFVEGSGVTEIITSTYETATKVVVSSGGKQIDVPVTKRSTNKKLAYAYTQEGQQDFNLRINSGRGTDYVTMLSDALILVDNGTETITNTGREVALQSRPSQTAQTGARAENSSEMEFAVGDGDYKRRQIVLSMPYAPDDTFSKVGDCYESKPSDAPIKAVNYGRAQNQLLFGNRTGINIQVPPEVIPDIPFSLIGITARNFTATYRTNGTTWTFDSNGVICSVDALLWGGLSGNSAAADYDFNDLWFPVAPGVTALPSPSAITDTSPLAVIGTIATVGATPQTALNAAFPAAISGDGVQDQTTGSFWVYNGSTWINVGTTPGPTVPSTPVVLPYNETVIYEGSLRLGNVVTKFDYSLTLLTVVPALNVSIDLGIQSSTAFVVVPAAVTTLAVQLPEVASGGSVAPPTATTALAPLVPQVSSGASAAIPLTDIAFEASTVPYVGTAATVVQSPAAIAGLLDALVPAVASGVSVLPPVVDIATVGTVPAISTKVPPVVSLPGTQRSGGGAIFPDYSNVLANDILLLVVETSGDGSNVTPNPGEPGWNVLAGTPLFDGNVTPTFGSKLHVWWRRAAVPILGENVTFSDSGDHQVGRVYLIRGCATTGDPFDVVGTATKATPSTTASAPSVTTTVAQTLVFSIVSQPVDSSSTAQFGPPANTGLTNLVDLEEVCTNTLNGGGFVIATGIKQATGNTGAITYATAPNSSNASVVIAFKP